MSQMDEIIRDKHALTLASPSDITLLAISRGVSYAQVYQELECYATGRNASQPLSADGASSLLPTTAAANGDHDGHVDAVRIVKKITRAQAAATYQPLLQPPQNTSSASSSSTSTSTKDTHSRKRTTRSDHL
eukprot:ANDGO_04858.mRNA.1 hypothetical protein